MPIVVISFSNEYFKTFLWSSVADPYRIGTDPDPGKNDMDLDQGKQVEGKSLKCDKTRSYPMFFVYIP